ncbi:MAG: phage minor head protein [Alphaproteobacteria bacterium]|jgi:hypothetical protein|nr:phage minor head protein [Alphaproteobacteria bacterium]
MTIRWLEHFLLNVLKQGNTNLTDPPKTEVERIKLRLQYSDERWKRIQRVKAMRPYLRRVAIKDNKTSHECLELHGIVRLADDPFWLHFYPKKCRCTVQQLSKRDMDRRGLRLTKDDDLPKRCIDALHKNSKTK